MSKRYVIEGEWTGYRYGQQRIVHRTVHTNPKLEEWVNNTYGIRYTDGTSLVLSTRPLKARERVKEIPSYDKLIRQCFLANVSSVEELYAKKEATHDVRHPEREGFEPEEGSHANSA